MIEQQQLSFPQTQGRQQRPASWAVTAFAIGIAADHQTSTPLAMWGVLILVFALLCLYSVIFLGRPTLASLAILLLLFSLGGGRNQHFENHRREDNILRYATEQPQSAKLSGVIVSSIDLIESERGPRIPSWMEVDTSRFVLQCEQIQDGTRSRPVSGRLSVNVNGHLVHARIGDRIELLGKLARPQPVRNPGGFDFREYLARQGIDGLLRVNHPQAVRVVEDSGAWRWMIPRLREKVRLNIKQFFVQNLSKDSYRLALSLLLGDRTQLQDEMRDRFVQSGTMHLLAISGLHVGILAGILVMICRWFNCSIRTTTISLILIVGLYALLTNHRPPVLRASMLIIVICLGMAGNRRIDALNLLSMCAGILLIWNPGNLFDIGAQLSFLAVGGIVWSSQVLRWNPFQIQKPGIPVSEGWRWLEWFRPLASYLYQGYVVTAAIWLVTLPLTVATFQLVAPIGFALNVLLIPYIGLVLGLGYLLLICGLLFPPLASPVAGLFDLSIQGLLGCVKWAQQLPGGHFYCSGIPVWWLTVYYVLIAWNWNLYGLNSSTRRQWKVLSIWIVIGFTLGLHSPARSGLKYTVFSVGHGLATVLELPGGETILYDCGTFGDGRRAERTVESYLRSRKISRIDAVIISHADHDHFSGLFELLDRFSVGTLIVTQQFLDFEQPSVKELCEKAASHSIPIKIAAAGDELSFQKTQDEVSLKVLHPPGSFHSKHDNANSLVLSIETNGHRMLLTGDLEKDGVETLVDIPVVPFDVVMAPHHGSRYSSPQRFFEWADPETVLVSSGDVEVAERLQSQLGSQVRLFATQTDGAISVEFPPLEPPQITPFLNGGTKNSPQGQ